MVPDCIVQHRTLYGHFGPRTLRTYIWCRSVPDTSAPLTKCLKTLRDRYRNVSRQFGKVRRPTAGESDSDLSIRTHVFRTVSSYFATLRQLRSICRSTSQAVLLSLVVSLVQLGGFSCGYCHSVWYGKTRNVWLTDDEKSLIICLAVSIRTDGRT